MENNNEFSFVGKDEDGCWHFQQTRVKEMGKDNNDARSNNMSVKIEKIMDEIVKDLTDGVYNSFKDGKEQECMSLLNKLSNTILNLDLVKFNIEVAINAHERELYGRCDEPFNEE